MNCETCSLAGKFPGMWCSQLRLICAGLKTCNSDSKLTDQAEPETYVYKQCVVLVHVVYLTGCHTVKLCVALILQIVFTF